jgi:hypothetical protein
MWRTVQLELTRGILLGIAGILVLQQPALSLWRVIVTVWVSEFGGELP